MSFLVISLVLIVVFMVGGLTAWYWVKAKHAERSLDQALLNVIEGQLATLRALLRIGQAEYRTLQRMQAMTRPDVFANSTSHEEPDEWRAQ